MKRRFATLSRVWSKELEPTLVSFSTRVHRQNSLFTQKHSYRELKMTITAEPTSIEIEEECVEFTSELFDCNQEDHSSAITFCCPCVTLCLVERKLSNVCGGMSRDLILLETVKTIRNSAQSSTLWMFFMFPFHFDWLWINYQILFTTIYFRPKKAHLYQKRVFGSSQQPYQASRLRKGNFSCFNDVAMDSHVFNSSYRTYNYLIISKNNWYFQVSRSSNRWSTRPVENYLWNKDQKF